MVNGDHHRQPDAFLLEDVLDGEDAGLGVQGVENRLEQQNVRAAVNQAAHLFLVGEPERVERRRAEGRIVDIGRDRQGPVGRTERSGDEPRAIGGLRQPLVAGGTRDPRALEVQLVGERLQGIVGLHDRRAAERVRLDDVGAGGEVLLVDFANHVGPRQAEQVVVALEVLGVIAKAFAAKVLLGQVVSLDHRAHRAVEDQDAMGELAMESVENRLR